MTITIQSPTTAVEAKSLGQINALAASPPLSPNLATGFPDDTHGPVSSLELYIVRVPGSKDVFLTPLKPRDRVVNAHDVQSSLYYLHADGPEDDALFETNESIQARRDERWSIAGLDTLRDELARPEAEFGAELKPFMTGPVKRKPLPTPPQSPPSEEYTGFRFPAAAPMRKPLVPPRSPRRDELRHTSNARYSVYDDESLSSTSARSPTLSYQPASEQQPQGRSLTLIRRDPSTGAQVNVAKIHDPPVEEVSSLPSTTRTKADGSPMWLTMLSAGYSKFTDRETTTPTGIERSLDLISSGTPLTRRLWLAGSRFADHSYSAPAKRQGDTSGPHADRRARGYAFQDPWGAVCAFSTATTGRTLHCRRETAASSAHSTSPSKSHQHHGAQQDDISELRFNLPTLHAKSRSENDGRSIYINRRSGRNDSVFGVDTAGAPFTSARDEDGTVDGESWTDYTLGRERAGGGFGGREPKLGKVVVQPAGVQMLDLVVAANLALWWRAYQRTAWRE